MIDCPVIGSHFFTGKAEGILIGHQHKGQIIVPEILVKTVSSRQIENCFYLSVNICNQFLAAIMTAVKAFKYLREPPQNTVFSQISI